MPVDVIVGGQGGDEGKGKIAAYLSLKKDYDICMRVPAPQAGHSTYYKGKRIGLALLPSGFVNEQSRLLIGAGGLISVEKLLKEIEMTGIDPSRLGIDYQVTVVTQEHLNEERGDNNLMKKIGSVGTGVGPCRRDKIMRKDIVFAKDVPELEKFLADTKREIYFVMPWGDILLEGDHGAKLDLVHGEYPFVTSRSTNASTILGEAGIGPKDVRDVYVVLKPYTTRVADGPLEKEIFDPEILEWAHNSGGETGTVSKRKRRIGEFEWENVKKVISTNSATKLAITHMDFLEKFGEKIGYDKKEFLKKIEEELYVIPPHPEISLLSYGPGTEDIKDYDYRKFQY